MTFAQVKGIYTTDMGDLASYVPQDPECFCVAVRAMVGPRGSGGEESFDVNVCTPGWLSKEVERRSFVIGRHYLFISHYSPDLIRHTLTKFIESCSGSSWAEVALKVSRIGHWEFEDYPEE